LENRSASEVDKLDFADWPAEKPGAKALEFLYRISGEAAQSLRGRGESLGTLLAEEARGSLGC
jgi:hypothetical protein